LGGERVKFAISVNKSGSKIAVNGLVYNFVQAMPASVLNYMAVGQFGPNTTNGPGSIKDLRFIPSYLTDAELIALTGGN